MSPTEKSSKEQELQKEDLLTIHSAKEAEQPFQYSVGRYGSLFLEEMQERKRFVGARCPKCKKVYIPPREVCGPCFAKMEEAVEVGPGATLMTYTIIRFPYIDPETGDLRPVPFGYGFFQFDGADTLFQHFFPIDDESKIKIGLRFEPVWREERTGSVRDVEQFVLVDD
jgi:uncharacterized OB-fold protein